MVITWGSEPNSRFEEMARTVIETPFTRRTWSELLFMMAGMPIAFIGIAFVGVTMAAGAVLAITFIGFAIIGSPCGAPEASEGSSGGWPAF